MKKLLQFIGYLCGYVLGFYGAMCVIDKIENRNKKTYFTV